VRPDVTAVDTSLGNESGIDHSAEFHRFITTFLLIMIVIWINL
jgi:hypothetical protein